MCEFFEVSRSGYYDFVRRMDRPNRDESLVKAIAQCQEHSRKTYGYRRVHIWLRREYGIVMNPKTVLRVMNKYGLLSEIRRRRKYKHMGQQAHKYENILNRDFHADKPNQKWVTDISYIHTNQGILYLCAIRDLYDNSIVAHQTGTEQTVNLVLNTIRKAKAKELVAAELQLPRVSIRFSRLFQPDQRIRHYTLNSMSRRGNCLDNAPAENFFSILKSECINRQKINDFATAKSLIDDYIHFYNHERIQLKTKLTPLELRRQSA